MLAIIYMLLLQAFTILHARINARVNARVSACEALVTTSQDTHATIIHAALLYNSEINPSPFSV